ADGLQRGGSPAVSMKTVLSSSDERVSLTAKAEQAGRALLDASARIDAPVARLRTMEAVARTPVRIDAKVGPLSLADLRALTGAKGGSSQKLSAVLRGELEARGSLNAPELRVRADVDQLGMQGKALGEVHLRYAYERKRSDLAAALKSPGGELNLKALTTLDLAWPALRKGLAYRTAPVQATLTSRDFDVSVFNGFTEAVRSIEGKLSADASLTGTVGAPAFRGQLGFRDGRVALAGFGRYQDIELSLEGSNERVELKKLFARSGGGSALLTARADLDRGRFTVRGGGELKRFPIISEDQLVATVSVRTSFEGQGSDEVINISRLAIPEAQIELPDVKRRDLQELARADDIVLMRNGKAVNPKQRQALARARQAEARQEGTGGAGGVVPEEEDAAEPLRRTLIRVDAPRNIWVHGKDVNAEVGFSEGFRVEYGRELTMFGEIRVLRGRVDVYRRLDIQRDSTVRFMGPVMTPYISATAVHVNENEGVTIYLNVRGQGTDVTIRATSQPPMPESEIYTLLATGRRQLQRGSGTSSSGAAQATSILGSVIASQTKKVLDDKLPLDVISIEAGDQGLNDAKLEAGTYLTDKFYVGYTGTPFGPSVNPRENSNAVRLEYQLSPRWSAEFEYGDAPAGGLDLLWGKDY
ncbi:MAG TPA: translocation/assembly module TamB domain-containing protein, partial [Myxococcaceae bacterium]|nr:translocation/assembly module TamB domain-containing protein [Myxococcaceae bacterium]